MEHCNDGIFFFAQLISSPLQAKIARGLITPWQSGVPCELAFPWDVFQFWVRFGPHHWLPNLHLRHSILLVYAQYKLWLWLPPCQSIPKWRWLWQGRWLQWWWWRWCWHWWWWCRRTIILRTVQEYFWRADKVRRDTCDKARPLRQVLGVEPNTSSGYELAEPTHHHHLIAGGQDCIPM